MSNPTDSNWDELLQQLGADPSEEAGEANQPVSQSAEVRKDPPSLDLDSVVPPAPQASGWDSLLDDFGIESPKPTPPEDPASVDSGSTAADVEPTASESTQWQSESSADGIDGAPSIEKAQDAEVATPAAADESGEPSVVDPPAETEPTVDETPAAEELAEPLKTEAPLPDIKASLSLPDWFPFAGKRNKKAAEATLAADTPASDPIGEDLQAKSPSVEGNEAMGSDPVEATSETLGDGLSGATQEEAEDAVVAGSDGAPADTEGEPPKTGRRRRRRGGRRRRRSGSGAEAAEANGQQNGDAPSLADDDADDVSAAASTDPSLEPGFGAGLDSVEPEDLANEDENGDADILPARGGEKGQGSAKSIPSWPETIGVVVDANIAMRSERKRATAGSSGRGARRGGGRGRSRGRRSKRPSE